MTNKMRFLEFPWTPIPQFYNELEELTEVDWWFMSDNPDDLDKETYENVCNIFDDWLRGGRIHPNFTVEAHLRAIDLVINRFYKAPRYESDYFSWETRNLQEEKDQQFIVNWVFAYREEYAKWCEQYRYELTRKKNQFKADYIYLTYIVDNVALWEVDDYTGIYVSPNIKPRELDDDEEEELGENEHQNL